MANPWEEFLSANKDTLSALDSSADKSFWMGDQEEEVPLHMNRAREAAIREITGMEGKIPMDPVEFERMMSWGADKTSPYLLPSHVRKLIEQKNFRPEAFQFDHFITADRQQVPVYKLVPVTGPGTFEEMANEEEPVTKQEPPMRRKLGLTIVGNPFSEMADEMEKD